VIAGIGFVTSGKKRRWQLRQRFRPQYDGVLPQEGDPRKAEGVLGFRQKRRGKFPVHPLSASDRSNFVLRWNEVQARGFEMIDEER